MGEQLLISARFRGPAGAANGGYSCGVVARRLGDSATVNLRQLPPLERWLTVQGDSPSIALLDGEDTCAEGRPDEPSLSVPEPPSMREARAAVDRYVGFRHHPYPECFVCGPHRDHHDGLHIFPGQVEGREVVATPWTPDPSLPTEDGYVAPEIVWAALDCPTGFASQFSTEAKPAALTRLRGTVVSPVDVGRPHIVIGWPIEKDGPQREGGSAIFTIDGELVAYATGLWVESG